MTSIERVQRFSFYIAVISVTVFVIFILLEAGTRIVEKVEKIKGAQQASQTSQPPPNSRRLVWRVSRNFRFFPYLMYRAPTNLKIEGDSVETDSRGLRSPEFVSPKPEGVYRIVVLGGSAAWGIGARNFDETFCGILRSRLTPSGATKNKIEVINAAQVGYNSTQELIFLEEEILGFAPDFVVFFNGFNELSTTIMWNEDFPEGSYWQIPYDYAWMKSRILSPPGTSGTDIFNLVRLSHFLDKLLTPPGQKNGDFSLDSSIREQKLKWGRSAIGRYRKNLELAFMILKDRRIASAVAVQPILSRNKKPAEGELEFVRNWPLITELYPEVIRVAEEAAATSGASFWDLTTVYENHPEQTYLDICHFNQRGHIIIGEKLAELIRPHLPAPARETIKH